MEKSRCLGPKSRKEVRQALECVEQITWPLAVMREFIVHTEPEEPEQVQISELLRELNQELAPVAESRGVSLAFRPVGVGTVAFSRNKLRETLFRVLESTIGCAQADDRVQVAVKAKNNEVRISIAALPKDAASSISSQTARRDTRKRILHRAAICRTRELAEAVGGHLCTSRDEWFRKIVIALPPGP